MFDPPTEDYSQTMPDITLSAMEQVIIIHALEVAKHNQEFRDGLRTKPFSGSFVASEIDNAIRVLSDLRAEATKPPIAEEG